MVSDIWLRTILIARKETCCRQISYSYRLTARVLLYAPSHRQDNTYHSLCYTSRGAPAWTRNISIYEIKPSGSPTGIDPRSVIGLFCISRRVVMTKSSTTQTDPTLSIYTGAHCMHRVGTPCIGWALHASGGHCMHRVGTACIGWALHASGGHCMHRVGTACIRWANQPRRQSRFLEALFCLTSI